MTAQTFLLPWPPSVNSIWRAYRGRNILSAAARTWKDAAEKELIIQRPKPIKGPVAIGIEFCPPTARAYDLDNRPKLCLDLLARNGIIDNDTAAIVQDLHLKVGTGFTGARVTVTPLDSYIANHGPEYLP